MKRIDDSSALDRRDDDPFAPATHDEKSRRTIDWGAFSHAVMPTALRTRAIAVRVTTTSETYDRGEPVGIIVAFRNRLPFPVRLRTDSPERWQWTVDGVPGASRVPATVPDRPAIFAFARGEHKRFRREWHQRIRISDREWEPVDPGSYTIGVRVNRTDADDRGLVDRTEIRITE